LDRSLIKSKLLKIMKQHPGRWFKPRTLLKYSNVRERDYRNLKVALIELYQDGQIDQKGRRQYAYRPKQQERTGVLSITTRGFGFVELKDGSEVFIRSQDMLTALHGDLVRVRISSRRSEMKRSGRIIEVIKRQQTQFVGTYKRDRYSEWVLPSDKKVRVRFRVDRVKPPGLKSGQMVIIDLLSWDDHEEDPLGKITEILGFPGDPGLDKALIIHEHGLPTKWTAKAIEQAQSFTQNDIGEQVDRRADLRKMECFTIDPETAQDFDDAVSIEKRDSGWRLGVHIADVSYYVNPGSPIDRGARQRGTSVYLVGSAIHMLPRELASDLCSLKPGVDRLAMSCIMDIGKDGVVSKYKIQESVIHSSARLTYEEVEKIIADDSSHDLAPAIHEMEGLRQLLFEKRKARGSIDLEIPEPVIKLDEAGFPEEIKPSNRLRSHRLVEEFMLKANQVVAEHLAKVFRKHKYHGMYRIHEPPELEDVVKLRSLLKRLGIQQTISTPVKTKDYQQLVEQVRESPYRHFIEQMALRSMTKAKYSIENKGHFGLAFHSYTHFTSPIRRYPDLMVHRLLKAYSGAQQTAPYTQKKLADIALHSSQRERIAMEAERDHIKLKQLQYLSNHVGEHFKGVISGVVKFGFFVELADTFIEGLVHAGSLEDDYYDYDDAHYQLIGRRTRKTYRLGDPVEIVVLAVSVSEGLADFALQPK